MLKVKNLLLILLYVGCSFSAFGSSVKPITCKDFQGFHEIKQKIISMDKTLHWDSKNCKVVGTKSIFPRKNKNGLMQYEKGLQVFLYDDNQLKFICLPGWVCKPW